MAIGARRIRRTQLMKEGHKLMLALNVDPVRKILSAVICVGKDSHGVAFEVEVEGQHSLWTENLDWAIKAYNDEVTH